MRNSEKYTPDVFLSDLKKKHKSYRYFLKEALAYTMKKYELSEEEARFKLHQYYDLNYAHF
jgi:hypothetical protein